MRTYVPAPFDLVAFVLYVLLAVIPLGLAIYGVYRLFSLPMRRREEARLLLKLLESGLAKGLSAEAAMTRIVGSRDRIFSLRFHLMAAHLDGGMRLTEALRKVPRVMPSQIIALLTVGERLGDVGRVLPACRQVLFETKSKMMSSGNFLIVTLFFLNPIGLLIWPFILSVIVPKFNEITHDLTSGGLPPLLKTLNDHPYWVISCQVTLMALAFVAVQIYISSRVPRPLQPLADFVNSRLPWRRKRLQRDFSSLLAMLLDAGVPEEQAVTLAAHGTDNRHFIRRGVRVIEQLRSGVSLMEALREIDDSGEFQWRVSNAAHGKSGFVAALTGWHDALEAKAYQLEQSASQVFTTTLVILNGCVVGVIVVGVFQVLTSVTQDLSLW